MSEEYDRELDERESQLRVLYEELAQHLFLRNYALACRTIREMLANCRDLRKHVDDNAERGFGTENNPAWEYVLNSGSVWEMSRSSLTELLQVVANRRAFDLRDYGVCLSSAVFDVGKLDHKEAKKSLGEL